MTRGIVALFGLWLGLALACGDPKGGSATASETGTTGASGSDASTATDSASSTGGGGPGAGERCAPVAELGGGASECGAGLLCCSDDPAAQAGLLPAYRAAPTDATHGVPIFSESNNVLSYSGVCVDPEGVSDPLLNQCAVPCNPRWSPSEIASVCGGMTCCQTRPLGPKDCVVDPVTGRWRALTGADILAGLTTWGSSVSTPQDPTAASCELFAGTADVNNPTFADCLTQLSVADQRGLCGSECPCVEDACDLKNPDAIPRCSP